MCRALAGSDILWEGGCLGAENPEPPQHRAGATSTEIPVGWRRRGRNAVQSPARGTLRAGVEGGHRGSHTPGPESPHLCETLGSGVASAARLRPCGPARPSCSPLPGRPCCLPLLLAHWPPANGPRAWSAVWGTRDSILNQLSTAAHRPRFLLYTFSSSEQHRVGTYSLWVSETADRASSRLGCNQRPCPSWRTPSTQGLLFPPPCDLREPARLPHPTPLDCPEGGLVRTLPWPLVLIGTSCCACGLSSRSRTDCPGQEMGFSLLH